MEGELNNSSFVKKKYWWVFLVVLIVVVGIIYFAANSGKSDTQSSYKNSNKKQPSKNVDSSGASSISGLGFECKKGNVVDYYKMDSVYFDSPADSLPSKLKVKVTLLGYEVHENDEGTKMSFCCGTGKYASGEKFKKCFTRKGNNYYDVSFLYDESSGEWQESDSGSSVKE